MSEQKVRNRPEISVIVPVYRVEKYLNDCIDSILAQTFADFELILVDDGSPDSCPALCDAAAAKDSRIRVIHQKNRGLSGARNAGLDAAEGEWIAFVDSDDMLLPQALEKAHSTAEKTGADVVLYGFAFTDENGKVYEGWDTTQYDEVIPQQEIYNRLVIGMYQSMCNKLFRRELFDGLRLPEGKKFEDTYTAPRIYERVQKMASIPESLYQYRQVDEALTPIREQYLHVRREVLTPEQALEHSTLLPYMVVWNKLYHRSIFAQLRFAEGKLNEDTLLIAYAYEKAEKIANIPDAMYLYRKVAGSIVNSKVTLRNLDRVEANYAVFECARRHGVTGSLCELYWVLLHSLIDVGSHLTAQERKTPRMQQAREYERRARRALRQEHAVTPQALGNTLCFILSQDRYFETRWKNRT